MDGATHWELLTTVFDTLSAEALRNYLELERIPCDVRADTALLGVARTCRIMVPPDFLHRARWLLAQAQVSDAELDDLATGALESPP